MKIRSKKLLLCSVLALASMTQAVEIPTGTISVEESVVLTGTNPSISWNIIFPTPELGIDDLVEVEPDGGIVPRTEVNMSVRVLAADIQTFEWVRIGKKWFQRAVYVDVRGYGRVNSGTQVELFNGTQPSVVEDEVVWSRALNEGDDVTFSAIADISNRPLYSTGEASDNVIVLKNGDIPPDIAGWGNQASLGTHIAPYLDSNGAVKIGPRDLIIAYELFFVMPHASGDLQDMIYLVTFQHDVD